MITCTFPSSFTDMDPDTLLEILRPSVRELGHGVRLCKVDSVESRTLVAFVATGGTFRIGYAYRNGSNIVVYCRNNMTGAIRARSPPVGVLVLNFRDFTTQRRGPDLISEDFDIDWLTHEAITLMAAELGAQTVAWAEAFDDLIDSLMELTVESLRRITRQLNREED